MKELTEEQKGTPNINTDTTTSSQVPFSDRRFRGAIRLGSHVFHAYDIEFSPRSEDYELFETYWGVIAIDRQLERHANLRFKVLLTEAIMANFSQGDDPEKHRKDFVEFRRSFLDELNGKMFPCASEMFPPFNGVVSTKMYRIHAGHTDAEYEFEVNEVSGGR